MVGAHVIPHIIKVRGWKECASFHLSRHGVSLECCMASMDMIPLLGCLSNIVSSSLMHSLMNWEGCQTLYGYLDLMLHNKSLKVESKSVPGIIYLPIVHPWSVVWPVWRWYPCVDTCTFITYRPQQCTQWCIEMDVNTCKDIWSPCHITHHQMKSLKACHVSFI